MSSVTEYWFKYYVNKGTCSLCGNSGVIDTRGVMTAAGVVSGRLNWCLCPNGQKSRRMSKIDEPPATMVPNRQSRIVGS